MPLIKDDSPLVLIPGNLDTRQRMFLAAIRVTISMLDVAYLRLRHALLEISLVQVSKSDDDNSSIDAFPSLFLDAFSIVDMTHRLWSLLDQMPQLKKTPDLTVFVRKLRQAEDLRNAVQHLRHEIQKLYETDLPTWGWLVWSYMPDASGRFHTFFALPGGLGAEKTSPKTEGPELPFEVPLDQVRLFAYGHQLDLSSIHPAVANFVPNFERTLRESFGSRPVGVGDVLVHLEGEFASPENLRVTKQ